MTAKWRQQRVDTLEGSLMIDVVRKILSTHPSLSLLLSCLDNHDTPTTDIIFEI